jgi:hypothetical protein
MTVRGLYQWVAAPPRKWVAAICLVLLLAGMAFLGLGNGDKTVGGLSIRSANDANVVRSGWFRKHGDTDVDKGACNLSVTPTAQNGLRFAGSTIIPWGGGVGFQTNGDLGDGTMAPVDAGNCRWTFADSGSFAMGDVTITASKGGTVEFDANGQVITRGLEFNQKR